MIPGVQSLRSDELDVNNWNRETSVFIKTKDQRENGFTLDPLPFPNKTASLDPTGDDPLISDNSRYTLGDTDSCAFPNKEKDIDVVSYYASMKNIVVNQWGQIYSYTTIDTGYQALVNYSSPNRQNTSIVFGGDVFIKVCI